MEKSKNIAKKNLLQHYCAHGNTLNAKISKVKFLPLLEMFICEKYSPKDDSSYSISFNY